MIGGFMEKKIPLRFFVVAFLWSWLFMITVAILANFTGFDINDLGIFMMPAIAVAALGPAMGAFYSLRTIEGKGAVKQYLKSFLSLKFGWKVWAAIFLILGLSSFIAWILPEFWGESRLPMLLPNVYIFPLYLLFMIFLGGGQEEIGWRGYILPYLENKFGLFFGSLILGIIWAVWHLPLWFIPGLSQSYMPFFVFMLLTIGYSFIFSWVRAASGKRLFSGLVVHGTANAFMPLFPTLIMAQNVNQIRWWIYCVIILVTGTVMVIKRTINKKHKTSA